MRDALVPCSLLLPFVLAGCPSDDGDTDATTVAVTTTASTTDASAESGSTAATAGTTETAGTSAEGSTAADTTTGTGPEVCETCDPAAELCFASIFDGPTEYSCRPIPEACADDLTCECITPLECPKSLQSCAYEGMLVIVECVEG